MYDIIITWGRPAKDKHKPFNKEIIMKKLTAILLSIIMLLSAVSLAACSKDKISAKLVYENAKEKRLSLEAYEAKIVMNMDIGASGQDISIKSSMEYDIKADGVGSDSPVSYADIEMKILGQTVDVISYTEGEYVYVDTMGSQMKMLKDSAFGAGYNFEATVNDFEIDVPASILETAKTTTDKDGNYVLSFTFDGKEHADILKDFTNNVVSGLDSSLTEYTIAVGTVKYELVIDEDYTLKGIKLETTMALSAGGVSMTVAVAVDSEYVAFNDDVTVTPPEGYLDYEELIG